METEILVARINDAYDIAQKTGRPKFFGFLTCDEAVLAQRTLEKRGADFKLFGGYENAQRVMLCCYPEWCDGVKFPITEISFTFRETYELRHRDFLGALMALGITRESLGDILVEKGRAVVFVKSEIADFIIENTQKIGRVGVEASVGYKLPLPQSENLISATAVVASTRLDCVVAGLTNMSRNKALEFIEAGLVTVNSVVCEKATKQITDGDVISVRSKGKFAIACVAAKTKKARTVLEFKKYF